MCHRSVILNRENCVLLDHDYFMNTSFIGRELKFPFLI